MLTGVYVKLLYVMSHIIYLIRVGSAHKTSVREAPTFRFCSLPYFRRSYSGEPCCGDTADLLPPPPQTHLHIQLDGDIRRHTRMVDPSSSHHRHCICGDDYPRVKWSLTWLSSLRDNCHNLRNSKPMYRRGIYVGLHPRRDRRLPRVSGRIIDLSFLGVYPSFSFHRYWDWRGLF
jgi:hypothetical protein